MLLETPQTGLQTVVVFYGIFVICPRDARTQARRPNRDAELQTEMVDLFNAGFAFRHVEAGHAPVIVSVFYVRRFQPFGIKRRKFGPWFRRTG